MSTEVGENLGDTTEGKQRDSARVPEFRQRRRGNNETERRAKQDFYLFFFKREGIERGEIGTVLPRSRHEFAFSHFSACAVPYFPSRCSCEGKEGD